MGSLTVVIIESFFLTLICIGALIGNTMLFILVAKTPALQTKGNIFVLNLAVADLLVAVVNMPITIATVIAGQWDLGKDVCLASGFLTLLTFVASCMALSMISVNRYHAIVHWTKYHEKYTPWRCALYIGIVWGVTIGLSFPPFFGWAKFAYDPGQSYCFAEWTASKSYTIFMIAACLCGPLSIMTYCYVKILKFKKASRRQVLAGGWTGAEVTMHSFSDTINGSIHQSTAISQRDRKLTRTITALILVFGLCWSPFAIIMLIQVFSATQVPRALDFGSLVFGYMNSLFNVFVYNATNKSIRNGYRKLFCCKPNQVDVGLSNT